MKSRGEECEEHRGGRKKPALFSLLDVLTAPWPLKFNKACNELNCVAL